jgi:RND superfamily putative drug exporter
VLEQLAHFVYRRRRVVIVAWIVLTAFGVFATGKVSNRWLEEFSIPGYSAYEANQRMLKDFGSGAQAPLVAVVRLPSGDVTKDPGVKHAFAAAAGAVKGSRTSSWFTTHNVAYVSKDHHVAFAEIFPPGHPGFSAVAGLDEAKAAIKSAVPKGAQGWITGRDALQTESSGGGTGPSIFLETLVGGIGALVILLFVFGTVPAVLIPLLIAGVSILNTFTLIWAVTYITKVSIIVQFLVALVGLGIAIDYALLVIFRYREELRHGADPEEAMVQTMRHAGRSVIVSGSTVAVGLLSMILLPLPFIRSIGVGGMLIPTVSVIVSITLLPALLAVLGHRINSLRVMPKRIVEGSDDPNVGFWNRWGRIVMRRPVVVAAVGVAIVAVLLVPGSQLNPAEAQAKDMPGAGQAHQGYLALRNAGITPGVLKPYSILVEGRTDTSFLREVAADVGISEGISGASVPPGWKKGNAAIVEAFPSEDGAAKATRATISRLQKELLPSLSSGSVKVTLGGVAAEDRDFVHAVYGNFPYVLLFVIVLTYILLARAFRSLILPLKAVILNLVSLGGAFGIVVFIFQWGHGSELIWNVPATQSIISWIPLMIFAFLYGISMDYEVFMLTRMREIYDETGDTRQAVSLGVARTGKLVTSASLVLMFAFFVLSTSPGTDIKQFGIGLAAGVVFDATVIRALLVPSLMMLLGRWNWWLPHPVARLLRVRDSRMPPAAVADSA